MQKKYKLIKICLAVILIFSILISTMPYKPKISNKDYNAKNIKTMSSERIQINTNKSDITINKIDSKTEEPLEGVNFELTPIEENIEDDMTEIKKVYLSYWVSGNILKLETYYGEIDAIVDNCNLDNLKGWAIKDDLNNIAYLPGDNICQKESIELHAITYKLTYFNKKLVKSETELPSNIQETLPKITYLENNEKIKFTEENSKITLLYKLTARGDVGCNYKITDTDAEYAFGDPLIGTIPESGEINCYVTKQFEATDINSDGNLENIATIIPGTYSSSSSSTSEITPAEDNRPTYTVTYSDGTPDGSVFGEKVFTGIKFGERTPQFIGNLERSGYEFRGWAPAVCETVEYDMVYMATWIKRAELFVVISPNQFEANVGDTIKWGVDIFNSNWADTNNVKLEAILNNGNLIFSEENITIKAGEKFHKVVEYVVTEEDAGKKITCEAKVTDFGNTSKTLTPIKCSGTHTTGINIASNEIELSRTKNVSKIASSKKLFNSERTGIFDEENYVFIKDESGVHKSNNQGVGDSKALSYIPIDLTNYSGKYYLNVNASISSEEYYDYGYVRLVEQVGDEIDCYDTSGEFVNISGEIESTDYGTTILGGKKYILLIGYSKDGSVDRGNDTFTINNVKIVFNSLGLKEKISFVTDSNGKITERISNGRYVLTETATIDGYRILEYPIIIEVQNNVIKIIENNNLDNITISNNNELIIENTTSRVIVHYYLKDLEGGYTQTKLKQDKIIKGIDGSNYDIEPLFCIQKDGIDYELENEIENGTKKYIIPENQSGVFGKEDINVNYYYKAKKRIIINKIWADNNNSLGIRPDFINVTLKAEIENEQGDIEVYPINNIESTVELNNLNNWTYTWANLESYDENGKEIMYYIEESEVPEQYYSVISFVDYEHYDITNYKYGSIKVIKVNSNNNNIKLGGAEFKLEKLIKEDENLIIDENFEPITLITSTKDETLGEAIFEKLEYGKYRLTEIKAPSGYSLQNKAIDIEITEEKPDFAINIINKPQTVLPSTGGNGSVVLTMLGVFCIAIAIKIKE